jgi:hypothetical protein
LGVYAKGEIIRSFFKDWFVKGSFPVEAAESIEMRVGESKFKPRGYALELVARIDHQIKIRLGLGPRIFVKIPPSGAHPLDFCNFPVSLTPPQFLIASMISSDSESD